MKKLIAGTVVLAATLFTAFTVQAAENLRWGFDSSPFPPWSEKSPAGAWSGFDVDIMDALCREMAVQCEIVEIAWDGMIPALQANKIDIIWTGMSITPEREQVIDFSDRYRRGPASYVASKDLSFEITAEGLKGLVIGVKKATNFASYLEHYFGDAATIKLYDTTDDSTADLAAGRIDVVLGDVLELDEFLQTDAGQAFDVKGITPIDPLLGKGAGAGIRKGEAELQASINAALKTILDSGEYDTIAKKYFTHDPYGR